MIRVVRYQADNGPAWGLVQDSDVVVIAGDFPTTGQLLSRGVDAIQSAATATGPRLALRDLRILSPITENQQVVCQGANYRKHIIEAGVDPDSKTFNMIFRKASSCLCGAHDPIQKPPHVMLLDYEVELGLVLGRDIVAPESFSGDALPDAVAALVIHNDVSARDVQVPQMQFYKGKSYRTFGPTGPFLVIVDEHIRNNWHTLRLTLKVNGEVRQDDVAGQMVFKPAATLTELSALQTLRAGDLIATGTPSGVAMQLPPPWLVKLSQLLPEQKKWEVFRKKQQQSGRYLNVGDRIDATIRTDDGSIDLGTMSNRIADAKR